MNKFGARKISLGGMTFDSEKEFGRWGELSLLQRGKEITDLKRQVKFELIPTQRNEYGQVIEKAVHYIADFVYIDKRTGEKIVEDAKGAKTKDYIIKRKLMLHVHGIRIREV